MCSWSDTVDSLDYCYIGGAGAVGVLRGLAKNVGLTKLKYVVLGVGGGCNVTGHRCS